MRIVAAALAALVFVLAAGSVRADNVIMQNVDLPVGKTTVSLPVVATLGNLVTTEPIPMRIVVGLQPLIDRIDEIVAGAGLAQPPGDYQSFNYNGTLVSVEGDRLWCKYHFRIDPHHAKPTNGSLVVYFRPHVEDNSLRFTAESIDLNVSNDLVRGIMQASGLERDLKGNIAGAVNEFLASPDALLQLPELLRSAEAQLESTQFAREGDKQVLVITGTLKMTPALAVQVFQEVVKQL